MIWLWVALIITVPLLVGIAWDKTVERRRARRQWDLIDRRAMYEHHQLGAGITRSQR